MLKGTKCFSLVLAGIVWSTSGCGSLVNSTRQSVRLASVPTGANVHVDNKLEGVTPLVASLKRKSEHAIKIELAGYQPYDLILKRRYSGWLWGNVLLGGLIGLAIDSVSGGMYKLTPAEVNAALNTQTASVSPDGTLVIVTVLKPEPSWRKVGQLMRADNAG